MTDHDTAIPLLAPVALAVDVPTEGLTRGQMGTVVESLTSGTEHALLVEFSDEHGDPMRWRRSSPNSSSRFIVEFRRRRLLAYDS